MIIVFGSLVVISLIGIWLTAMYIWWRREIHAQIVPVTIDETLVPLSDKMTRIARRKWYITLLYGKKAFKWNAYHLTEVFYKVFPKAKVAFAKRDMMTGLKDGPSSYFLQSISEKDKKKK